MHHNRCIQIADRKPGRRIRRHIHIPGIGPGPCTLFIGDNRAANEALMVAELNFLEVWIPEQMQPGTMFLLDQSEELGKAENPFWAVLACPSCGCLGLITRQQCAGLEAMICGSDQCSAEYFLEGETIRYRSAS